ncbi:right-handed parallel beta-helix repeat-containing protein [Cryobacterium aureum]|uniref:right-handed parallel beta-helix repeat-containing protein n=1 Tax=Cryobacterium aureum TaxID=995037 RepID=UPI00101AEAE3|nr:right-handed parallel beta-helix repeat-containing protein [Cryobacterium aureum]
MIRIIRSYPVFAVVSAAVAGAVLGAAIIGGLSAASRERLAADAPLAVAETAAPAATPTPTPRRQAAASCGEPTVTVADADELTEALGNAAAGDAIELVAGTYIGNFVAENSGTADAPITLCGTADAILDGGDESHGYVFHLDGAKYWHLTGFTVTNGQKGLMADTTVGTIIEGLTVNHIGDEAIHLRKASTDNVIVGNTISDTGLRKPKFGEGIYIGTAESNWCDISDCSPDLSDRNRVEFNTIFGTTSESVDIKEGTSGGIVKGNTFDGSFIVEADSWVDVKGNDWTIEGNVGTTSPNDGFQTHEIVDGWGTGNVFRGNTANVNGPGFGFSLTPVLHNVADCSNTTSGAGEGFSNTPCSP